MGLTPLDVAPFSKMSDDDFLGFGSSACLLDTTDIESSVLSVEAADTTHVIAIVGKLFAGEAIFGSVRRSRVWARETVQIFTLPAIGTASSGKEETDVFVAGGVGASEARVEFYLTAGLRFCFTGRMRLRF